MKRSFHQFSLGAVLVAALAITHPAKAITIGAALEAYRNGGKDQTTAIAYTIGWFQGVSTFCSMHDNPWASNGDFVKDFYAYLDKKQNTEGADWNPRESVATELSVFLGIKTTLAEGRIDCKAFF